jgi:magnesium chelatase family protein
MTRRPFVQATAQTTPVALLGGGSGESGPKPGLVSLAHRGLLLADEFLEWPRPKVDSLRLPLQDKQVVISRRDFSLELPADFQLIAAANPCPCGYDGHPDRPCTCTAHRKRVYLERVSGPVMDRVDLKVRVAPLEAGGVLLPEGEDSATVRLRVLAAAARQAERYQGTQVSRNAELRPGLWELSPESAQARTLLPQVQRDYLLTSRGLDKVRAVARTIADLEGVEEVGERHVREAARYAVPIR